MGSTLVPHMAIDQLVNSNSLRNKVLLDEPGPHRELAIIIRPSYSSIESVELLSEFFTSSRKKKLKAHSKRSF